MIGFGQGRDRAERLLTLACVLQVGRPLSLADLRQRFELYTSGSEDSTRRQFERDKQDLRALGIDVVTRTLGDTEAYAISTRLPAVAISWTEEELIALATLSAAVGDQVSGTALAKVSHHRDVMPDERPLARIRIDLGEVPAVLAQAQADHRRVRFPYRNARGEVAERLVEPWAIATRRSQTYVTGYDHLREAGRAFRVDRILGEVVDAGEATMPRPVDGLGVPLAPEDRSDVCLRIPGHRLPDALAMGAVVVTSDDEATTQPRTQDTARSRSSCGACATRQPSAGRCATGRRCSPPTPSRRPSPIGVHASATGTPATRRCCRWPRRAVRRRNDRDGPG